MKIKTSIKKATAGIAGTILSFGACLAVGLAVYEKTDDIELAANVGAVTGGVLMVGTMASVAAIHVNGKKETH